MRKLWLISILALLSLPSLAATTYYACSDGGNINDASKFGDVQSGTCACVGSATYATIPVAVTGDTLSANKCTTTITVNVDPGDDTHQAVLISDPVAGGTPAANAFTLATATCNGWAGGAGQAAKTLHANVTAGQKNGLTVTGSTAGCIISGAATGGAATSATGISDNHTVVTLTFNTGPITGGSAGTAYGFGTGSTGPVTINANALPGSGAVGLDVGSAATVTMNGDCIGSDSVVFEGCYNPTGTLNLTGNLIFGKKGGAIRGFAYYTPGATNYACFPKNSSYAIGTEDCTHTGGGAGLSVNAREMPFDPGVANVKSGLAYGSETGTLASGGNSGSAH